MTDTNRPLRVFLCHSSTDKPIVRELYEKLRAESWIDPWLDEEKLYPGYDWNLEIEQAIEETDVIIVCLSNNSITKEGYVQKEIKKALDFADYKPDGTVFIIPVRLEECKPPTRLAKWQYADYFEGQRERAFQRLLVSLKRRADYSKSNMKTYNIPEQNPNNLAQKSKKQKLGEEFAEWLESLEEKSNSILPSKEIMPKVFTLSNGMEFMRVPAGKFLMGSDNGEKIERPQHTVDIAYDYWMARYPITNEQYNEYVIAIRSEHIVSDWQMKKDHPVVGVTWDGAVEYCNWLNNLLAAELPSGLFLRLPTEAEWEKAARGTDGREYPWGNYFDQNKCNSDGSETTPVSFFPARDSPYGCADMSGNVWQWTRSVFRFYPYDFNEEYKDEEPALTHVLRGGSFFSGQWYVRCAFRLLNYRDVHNMRGFRVVLSPLPPK